MTDSELERFINMNGQGVHGGGMQHFPGLSHPALLTCCSVASWQFMLCLFQEHLDYEIIQSLNPEFNKAVVRVNVFKEHRQTIQVISLPSLFLACGLGHYATVPAF